MRRRTPIICALAVLLTTMAYAQNVSGDAGYVTNYLEETRYELRKLLADVDASQWNAKPDPDKWSIAEICEHIRKAEMAANANLKYKILTEAGRKEAPAGQQDLDQTIIALATNRTIKMQAPESIQPGGTEFKNKEEFLAAFDATRDQTIAFFNEVSDQMVLRSQMGFFPPMQKDIDGMQWFLVIAAHTRRHAMQLIETMQNQ